MGIWLCVMLVSRKPVSLNWIVLYTFTIFTWYKSVVAGVITTWCVFREIPMKMCTIYYIIIKGKFVINESGEYCPFYRIVNGAIIRAIIYVSNKPYILISAHTSNIGILTPTHKLLGGSIGLPKRDVVLQFHGVWT